MGGGEEASLPRRCGVGVDALAVRARDGRVQEAAHAGGRSAQAAAGPRIAARPKPKR